MATPAYIPGKNPSENLNALLQSQNAAGLVKALVQGWEPFDVLIAKTAFNANDGGGGGGGDVNSVNGQTGSVVLTKSSISLGNVDNTSDANKPVSAAQLAAIILRGDVFAAVDFGTDNVLLRSDGVGKGAQATGIGVDDSDNVSGVQTLTADTAQVGGISLASGGIALNKALAADDTYSGITITGVNGGENIAQWEVVYFSGSDTEWMRADADAAGKFPASGIATAATTNGTAAVVMTYGVARNDAWAWTVGGALYLSATVGTLTQTAPAVSGNNVQRVGYAITADIVFLDFNSTYVEVA